MASEVNRSPSFRESFFSSAAKIGAEKGVLNLVADYVYGTEAPFGKKEWLKYFNAKTHVFEKLEEIPKSVVQFWYGRDPVFTDELACMHHFPPTFCPKSIETDAIRDYTLLESQQLADFPRITIGQNVMGICSKSVDQDCWIVMRKDIIARKLEPEEQFLALAQLNADTGAGYETRPQLLNIVTVLATHHVVTQSFPFRAGSVVTPWTYSRCAETIDMQLGDQMLHLPIQVGGFDQNGLRMFERSNSSRDLSVGIAALKVFVDE